MALHLTLQDHDNDPPSQWTVRKSGRKWHLLSAGGGIIDTFNTKTAAENARTQGRYFDLYHKEGRWFRGEPVPGWKPYAVCKPNMDAVTSSG